MLKYVSQPNIPSSFSTAFLISSSSTLRFASLNPLLKNSKDSSKLILLSLTLYRSLPYNGESESSTLSRSYNSPTWEPVMITTIF